MTSPNILQNNDLREERSQARARMVYVLVVSAYFAVLFRGLGFEVAARVGSYAYVNPVVAVFLGWALAAEPVTARTIAAAAM